MGLEEYRAFKRQRRLQKTLAEFGINIDDLKKIAEIRFDSNVLSNMRKALAEFEEQNRALAERVKELESKIKVSSELSKEEQRKINEKYKAGTYTTPQDVVNMFINENEEFYPNGIGNTDI